MGGGAAGRGAKDLIVLAPCGADEVLPTNADLPADLFTSCLTTPMPIALRWFVRQNRVRVLRGRGRSNNLRCLKKLDLNFKNLGGVYHFRDGPFGGRGGR